MLRSSLAAAMQALSERTRRSFHDPGVEAWAAEAVRATRAAAVRRDAWGNSDDGNR